MKRLLIFLFSIISLITSAQTPIEVLVPVKVVNPYATEWKRGPWASTTSAKTNVPQAIRERGLTVFISSCSCEYWWPTSDVTDGALVLKNPAPLTPFWPLAGDGTLTDDVGIDSDGHAFDMITTNWQVESPRFPNSFINFSDDGSSSGGVHNAKVTIQTPDASLVVGSPEGLSGVEINCAQGQLSITGHATLNFGSGVGSSGQVLTSAGISNHPDWQDQTNPLPVGGTTGQVLAKTSNSDFSYDWVSNLISLTFSAPLTGGTINTSGTVGISDAVANGTGKGAATFEAADFNSSAGDISIDYTNGQKASGSQPGFLSSTDWSTFSVGSTSFTTLGTVTTGTWHANGIGVPFGGTGQSSLTPGDIWYGSSTPNITAKLGIGTSNQTVIVDPSTTLPVWSSINVVDLNTTSTAGSTVTLNCNNQYQRMFAGSATFSSAKTMAVSSTTNTRVFDFNFEVTNVAATLTLPSIWLMSDSNFNTGTRIWTPPAIGKYEMSGTFDGTNWKIKIGAPFL